MNDMLINFVEYSNVYNGDRSSDAIQSKVEYKNIARSRLFCRITKRSMGQLLNKSGKLTPSLLYLCIKYFIRSNLSLAFPTALKFHRSISHRKNSLQEE